MLYRTIINQRIRFANANFGNKNYRSITSFKYLLISGVRIIPIKNNMYFSTIKSNTSKSLGNKDKSKHNKVFNRKKSKKLGTRSNIQSRSDINVVDKKCTDLLNFQLYSNKSDNIRALHALLPNYDGFRKCLIKSSLADISYQNNTALNVLDNYIEQIKTKRDNEHVQVFLSNIYTMISTILDSSNQAKLIDAITLLKSNTGILFLIEVTNNALTLEQTKSILNMIISLENKKNIFTNNPKSSIFKDDIVLNYLKLLRFRNIKMDKLKNIKSILSFDVLTLNLIIATCINKGAFDEALQWYFCTDEILKINPDEFTYQILLSKALMLESLDSFFYLLDNVKNRKLNNAENKVNIIPIYENILKLSSNKQPINRQFIVAERIILDTIALNNLNSNDLNKLLSLTLPIYMAAGKVHEILKLNSYLTIQGTDVTDTYYKDVALSALSLKKHDLFLQCFNEICISKSFENVKEIKFKNSDEISLYIIDLLDKNSSLLESNGNLIGLATIWLLDNSKKDFFIESLWEKLQVSVDTTQSSDGFSMGLTCLLNYFNIYATNSIGIKESMFELKKFENISILCGKLINQNTILSLKNADLLINLHRIFNNCDGMIKLLRTIYSQAANHNNFKNLSMTSFTKACHLLSSNGKYNEVLEFFSIYMKFVNIDENVDYKLFSPIMTALQELNDVDSMVQLVGSDMHKIFKLQPTEGHVYRVIETLRQNKRYNDAILFFCKFNRQYNTRKLISVVIQCCAEGQLGEMLFNNNSNRHNSTLLNDVVEVLGNTNNIAGHYSNYKYSPSSWGTLNNKLVVNIMLSLAGKLCT